MVTGNGRIYAAAENALFFFDYLNPEIQTLTTIDGLSGEFISTLYYSEIYELVIIGYENGLIEIPISTLKIGSKNLPAGGGGFFRLYPYALTKWVINHINKTDKHSTSFYFHPWEIDPEQPRQEQASLKSKFRHYLNLDKTESRLNRILEDFEWDRMDKVFFDYCSKY